MSANNRPHKWTQEQDQFLLSAHGTMPNKDLAELLGLSGTIVKKRWLEIGGGKPWPVTITKAQREEGSKELAFIRENVNKMTWRQIGEQLGISERAAYTMAQRHGLGKKQNAPKRPMTMDEAVDYARQHTDMSYSQISKVTGYTKNSMQRAAKKRGATRKDKPNTDPAIIEKAIPILRENIDKMTWNQLAEATGLTAYQCQGWARKYGIRKRPTSEFFHGIDKKALIPFFQENIDKMTWKELGNATGLSMDQMFLLTQQNGIRKTRTAKPAKRLSKQQQANAVSFIQAHIQEMTFTQMAESTGISANVLDRLAKINSIAVPEERAKTKLTPETEAKIVELMNGRGQQMTWKEIEAETGTGRARIKNIMKRHGIEKQDIRKLRLETDDDMAGFIRDNIESMSLAEIAEITGKCYESVRMYAKRRGIQKSGKQPLRRWTAEEEQFLLANLDKGQEWIAGQLNRTVSAVDNRRKTLLHKNRDKE